MSSAERRSPQPSTPGSSRWGPRVETRSPSSSDRHRKRDNQNRSPSSSSSSSTTADGDDNTKKARHVTEHEHGGNGTDSKKRKMPPPSTNSESNLAASTATLSSDTPAVPRDQYSADFRFLEEVEWGPREEDDGYDSDQTLAPRPKNRITSEMCMCSEPPKDGPPWTCRSYDCINFACREECRKSNCVEHCGNQRISRRDFKKVEVFDAGPKGYGLRVLEDCVKGDIIEEYTGQAVRAGALTKLFRRYQHERRLYIMALDDKVYLDAKKAGGLARYINHSCNPNCKVEKWRVKGVYRAAVEALQEIKAGSELTFDYQWSRKAGRAPTKCHCGEATCRGTLEISRSLEEAQLEQLMSNKWVSPKHRRADERVVNRTIRFQRQKKTSSAGDNSESDNSRKYYVVGEITEFNIVTKLHKILYQNLEERWENLNSGDPWMLLEEEHSPTRTHSIARKTPPTPQGSAGDSPNRMKTGGGGSEFRPKVASGGSLLDAFSSAADAAANQQLFYLYVQTPIKEVMFTSANSMKDRVERNCQVSLTLQQMARPPLPCNADDPEDVTKFAALDQSRDGTVWKVSITGADKDVAKANAMLVKNIQYWQKKLESSAGQQAPGTPKATSGSSGSAGAFSKLADEVIFPRVLAEHIKRRLPSLRERCRNVSLQVKPSESKSKQIARLVLEGGQAADLNNARTQIRNTILSICSQELPPNDPLPLVSIKSSGNNGPGDKVPRDFGFLGGTLTKEEFESLLRNGSKPLTLPATASRTIGVTGSTDATAAWLRAKQKDSSLAGMDLNQSPFFTTFEILYGPIWAQSEDDMGRISHHQLVGDADSTETRKVYFGCEPADLVTRWGVIHKRAQEVLRGIRFLHLGTDQIYHRFIMQSQLFNYVEATTGVGIAVDTVTGNHLRIDGVTKSGASLDHLPERVRKMTDLERADLAEELIRLQIEVYRDQFTRKHSWVFGRDWSTIGLANEDPVPDSMKQIAASFGQLDSRSAPHTCVEMAEVVAQLELPSTVSAHASIILYRFVSVASDPQMKARDAALACVFIANKAQKTKKWRRLEAVLEAGYKAFYPGTLFDAEKEEVVKLEQRVVAAEQELLRVLEYDVFVPDMDSLAQAISQSGKFIETVFNFAFSGQILGAGAQLWLKHGIEYIFAASAAILKADVKEVVGTLGLIPLKVSQAVKLIADNARYGRPTSHKVPSNPLLEGDRSWLDKYIPRIEEVCVELTAELAKENLPQPEVRSAFRRRCLEIGKANLCCYSIRGVPQKIVAENLLRHVGGIEAESGCSIYLSASEESSAADDIAIQGPWRAVAIADKLLRSSEEQCNLPAAEAVTDGVDSLTQLQVKTYAGLIDAKEICTSGGWDGTLHPVGSRDQAGRQLGGRSCLAGKISVAALRSSGLRWWIREAKGSSPNGNFTEMFSVRCGDGDKLEELADMTLSMEDAAVFPVLSSFQRAKGKEGSKDSPRSSNLYVAVSLQRWPSEKVSSKEEKRNKKSKAGMATGLSAGALQEMQLLTMLHKLVPSPYGHPNFILPVGIAIPRSGGEEQGDASPAPDKDDPMFSLFRTTQENERAAVKEKTVKNSPHLVFQPCPFVLQRFLSRKKGDVDLLEAPAVVSTWFNDLVSALVHCHSNHVVLRTLQPDQIVIDHSGVAKLSGLYRATVLGQEDRRHPPSIPAILKELKKKGSSKRKEDDDDAAISPLTPPEILLGSPKHTKESDVWTLGCVLANILLGKPAFVGRDRQSILTAMYKIVGIPAQKNFDDGTRFPHYVKPTKKYRRGVEKAMEHMLKGEHGPKYAKAIDLIARMLHLDPSERCTAEEALRHPFLIEHTVNTESVPFREDYVAQWMELKSKLISSSRLSNGGASRTQQRRALSMLASATGADSHDEDGDGLYNFEL